MYDGAFATHCEYATRGRSRLHLAHDSKFDLLALGVAGWMRYVGGVDEQLELMSLYMDEDGDAIGAQGIIDPGELEELEKAFGIK